MKTDLCAKQDIKLLQIFENEWISKRSLVEAEIRRNLQIFKYQIDADECNICLLKPKAARKFINENCMYEYINSSVNVGLFHNDEIVSVMSFCKTRFNKKYDWELTRVCNKKDYNIVGAS